MRSQKIRRYGPKGLVGMQVPGVVSFPPGQIADCRSEAPVPGVYSGDGVVLVVPPRKVEQGDQPG